QFKEKIDPIRLPFYQAEREPRNGSNEEQVVFRLDKNVSEALAAIAKEESSTIFATLTAGFSILIHLYTLKDTIAIGTPIACREHFNLQDQIGLYLNTVVLKLNLKDQESFIMFLRRTQQIIIDAQTHQIYPFNQLIDDLKIPRIPGQHPLFNIMIDMVSFNLFDRQFESEKGDGFENLNLGINAVPLNHHKSKYDIVINCAQKGTAIEIAIEYDINHYGNEDIAQMGEHLRTLFQNISVNPHQRISSLTFFKKPQLNIFPVM
ncbi:condensation domain-containing protein, partial [Mucilaginibacter sp. RCC_168]|uniref:condensation domain-containing protein n=1 Tax=Mucilaginibacter sp. RCC_168 TaxID=3239221 RepID=UPI0035259897